MYRKTFIALSLLVIAALEMSGMLIDDGGARRAVHAQGFSKVLVVDHAWFFVGARGCGNGDSARFTVLAKNAVGDDVNVYVCTGWLKGSTIRTR